MSATRSRSGPVFFPGQEELAAELFEPGGEFERIRAGAPLLPFEQGAQQRTQQIGHEFARRGLTGTGLEAQALTQSAAQTAQGRESTRLGFLQSLIQPAGTFSLGGKSMGFLAK